MKEITLTAGQAEAVSKMAAFLDSTDPVFVLSGSAGSGKSLLAGYIPALIKQGRVLAAAPTHKALGVLSKRMPGADAKTIHSFLGLKPKRKGNISTLVQRHDYDASEYFDLNTVVVDEASMIDSTLLNFIRADVKMWNRKYIFVGDQYQLFPVGERNSPCFHLALPAGNKSDLTEIRRHAGPIVEIATLARNAIIEGKAPPIKGAVEDGKGVFLLRGSEWDKKLQELTEQRNPNPDFCRVIAYKNDTVMRHNQAVRGYLGADPDTPFSAGDNVVANEAWVYKDEIIFGTGTEFIVSAMEPQVHPVFPQLEGWQVWLEGFGKLPLFVLDRLKCGVAYKRKLDELVTAAQAPGGSWRPFYALTEYYADLRVLSSITAHKSQGSEFTNVMLDLRDIYSNQILAEADRSFYVALTRGVENVFIKL